LIFDDGAVVQSVFRYSRRQPSRRLNRENLIQRLEHQSLTFTGTVRLINVVLIFVMMVRARPPTHPHPVTRFATSPPTNNCPQPKEALPAVSA
jgi:hypothetical protein